MAKRFTDTDIWKKPWFRKSSPTQKCLFRYFVDNCDHAGILDIDYGLMSFMIGEEIEKEDEFYLAYLEKAMGYLDGKTEGVQMKQLSVTCGNIAKMRQSRGSMAHLKHKIKKEAENE